MPSSVLNRILGWATVLRKSVGRGSASQVSRPVVIRKCPLYGLSSDAEVERADSQVGWWVRDHVEMSRIKNLRRPITATINGKSITLLTIGHVAHAVGRTTASVKYWERCGLFPLSQFWLSPDDSPAQPLRLYPETFVKSLIQIRQEDYLGARLDRDQWPRFYEDVTAAYERAMAPLRDHPGIPQGVVGSTP